jgi:hypothetical protein
VNISVRSKPNLKWFYDSAKKWIRVTAKKDDGSINIKKSGNNENENYANRMKSFKRHFSRII